MMTYEKIGLHVIYVNSELLFFCRRETNNLTKQILKDIRELACKTSTWEKGETIWWQMPHFKMETVFEDVQKKHISVR